MITTIVFDFGNVLGFFDYGITIRQLLPYTPLDEATIRRRVYGSDLEDAYESGRIDSGEFLHRVRQLCELRCSDEMLEHAYSDMFTRNEEVCALVPRLKPNYRILLGSNTTELHSRHFRKQFADVFQHFDGLVLSHEVGARKPRAEFFLAAQRMAGVPGSECVFIDDLPANVRGAQTLGWQGIVYTRETDLVNRLNALGVRVLESL